MTILSNGHLWNYSEFIENKTKTNNLVQLLDLKDNNKKLLIADISQIDYENLNFNIILFSIGLATLGFVIGIFIILICYFIFGFNCK